MAAKLTAGPHVSRDKGSVRADFTFELSGPAYDRLELSWRDPSRGLEGQAPADAAIVNVENKREVIAPVHVPDSYFTGDTVVTFRLRDADEVEAAPLWEGDYRLLEGPAAEPA